jgi:alpha-glucosidase (family GH31 glycosyl hydrolase)
MTSTPLRELVVRTYPGRDGKSVRSQLYEDDGLTNDYLAGKFAITSLIYEKKDSKHR